MPRLKLSRIVKRRYFLLIVCFGFLALFVNLATAQMTEEQAIAVLEKAHYLFIQNKYDEVIALLKPVVEQYPHLEWKDEEKKIHAHARGMLGDSYYFKGNWKDALEHLEEAIKDWPEATLAWSAIARCRRELALTGSLDRPPIIAINNKYFPTTISPVLRDGETLIVLRDFCEYLVIDLKWEHENKAITVFKTGKIVKFRVGSKEVMVDDKKIILNEPVTIVSGHAIVPLRFLAENFSLQTRWDEKAKIAYVFTQPAS